MSKVQNALPLPDMYYDAQGKDYYIENDRGMWIKISETSSKRHLKMQGYSSTIAEGEAVSPLDRVFTEIQIQQDVSYASSLAGYNAGVYEINRRRILVTDSPHLITPKEGAWPLLEGILEGMFNDPAYDQRPHVYGWLKMGIASVKTHHWQASQAFAMAGPVQSAKSLFQALVTEMLGGRVAHPYQHMTGATAFNADLFGAEHLVIEDAAESTDIRTRRHFGAQIKAFGFNNTHHCHGKNKTPLTLTPIWRVTISLNDDPERLMVLPPIDGDIADKIMLLKVRKRDMPMPTETGAQQAVFWAALMAELPAFVHFLEHWEIPAELRSDRCGIIHYHHPELLAGLEALSPEQQLLEMIDQVVFHPAYNKKAAWVGSAIKLQTELTDKDSSCQRQAQTLLHSTTACGNYLSRLTKDEPERVASRKINGRAEYTIQPPPPTTPAAHAESENDPF
jgi:hypothetical protein